MAKTPFFEILLKDTQEVITSKFAFYSFVFEQCYEKDNMLTLSLNH